MNAHLLPTRRLILPSATGLTTSTRTYLLECFPREPKWSPE